MKAITICSFLFLFSATALNAQESLSSSKFGVHVTPTVTKQVFKNAKEGVGKTLFGIGLGVDYFHKVSNKIQIKTGLSYQYNEIDQVDYALSFATDWDPINGFNPLNSWIEGQHKIHYVGIPVEIRFKLKESENHFYTKLGIGVLLKIGETSKSIINSPDSFEYPTELKSSAFDVSYGIGYQWILNSGEALYFEPQVSYSLNSLFDEQSLINKSKLLNYGLVLGLRF